MDASEREFVLGRLAESRTRLLASVSALTPEQWVFRAGADRWSIADCVEHVVLVEKRVIRSIGKMLERPAEPEKKPLVAGKDDFLRQGHLVNRSERFNAPEMAHPKGNWQTPAELLAEFEQARGATVQFASETDGDLRSHFFPHMVFGEMDCYQWLMLLPLHCERHAAQIAEIKTDTQFPVTA